MRVPDNTLYLSRIRTYGTLGLQMDGAAPEAGCPRLYRAKYEDFRIKEPESPYSSYGSLIHDALFLAEQEGIPLLPDALNKAWERLDVSLAYDMYEEAIRDLTKYMERPDNGLVTISVEQHLTAPLMEIDGQQYFFGGYIDKVEIDPTDPTTIYVRDYKTNRQPPSQVEVDGNNQFTLYCCLVRKNLDKIMPGIDPESIRFIGVFDAIKWYELNTERPHWQMDQFEDWMRAILRRIVADQEGLPILNDGCNSCPIKMDCPAFRKLPGDGKTIADRMSTTTDLEQRTYFMQSAQLTVKALTKAIKEVQGELLAAAEADEAVTANGITYQAEEAWTNDYDVPKLHEILGDAFYSAVTPVGYKVDAIVKEKEELKAEIEAVKTRYPKEGHVLKARKAE